MQLTYKKSLLASIFIAIIMFTSATCLAQNIKNNTIAGSVEYNVTHAQKKLIPKNYSGILSFNNSVCLFVYEKSFTGANVRKDTIDESGRKVLLLAKSKNPDDIGKLAYTDFERGKQIFRDVIHNKAFIYEDSLKIPKWKIQNEQKSVGNLKCQKATTHYYGRDYEVWFTNDIPAPYGPWKLVGLPGLILEAKSLDNEVEFIATKVNIPQTIDLIEIPSYGKKLDGGYLAFRGLQDQKAEESRKRAETTLAEHSKPGLTFKLKEVTPSRFEKSLDSME